jgi:hypothetical protein
MCEAWALLDTNSITADCYPIGIQVTLHCKDRDRVFIVGDKDAEAVDNWFNEMTELYSSQGVY